MFPIKKRIVELINFSTVILAILSKNRFRTATVRYPNAFSYRIAFVR